MEKLNYGYVCVLILSLIFLQSCEEQILEPDLKGQIEQDELLKTKQGFLLALNGAYEPLNSGAMYDLGLVQPLTKMSDDGWTWRKETEEQTYNYTSTKTEVTTWWEAHYQGIARTNTILARLQETDVVTGTVKESIEGQVKFLRALYYFNLARIYGGVPLIVSEVTSREESEQPRASIEDVYNQIKTDLSEAISLLPVSYTGSSDFKVGMATQGAAKTLKAKVHLELTEWNEAASLAEEVIASGEYELHDDYINNFYGNAENGIESIFEIQFSSESGAVGGGWNFWAPQEFQGGSGVLPTDADNDFGVSTTTPDGIVQAFESGDLRKPVAIDTYGLPNFLDPTKPEGSLYHINKYFDGNEYPPGQNPFNFPLFRYSEVLLIAAEALNEQGANNSDAIMYVNMVRNRAGLSDLENSVTSDQDAFRQAIRHERRVEMCFEGKRYFDLNRWAILQETIAKTGVDIASDKFISHPITGNPYHLYPIPATEFINNAKLGDQNPGY